MARSAWKRRVGRVTVYTQGNRYWIDYRQGKVVRRPVGPSREDARGLAARINADLAEGAPTSLAYRPLELGVLVRVWLEHHEYVRHSSVGTIRRYRTAAQHLLNLPRKNTAA